MSFYCGFSGKSLFCYLGMSASHAGPNREERGALQTQREQLRKHVQKVTKTYR